MNRTSRHYPATALLTMLLLLSGCATVNLENHVAETPAQALELAADESDPAVAQRYLLRIASRFQDQGDHRGARTILRSELLTPPQAPLANQYRLLAMASALELDDSDWAEALTRDLSSDAFLQYPEDLINRAARLQAETQALAGQPLDAAMTLVLLSQNDSSLDPQPVHDRIWQFLKTVPANRLQAAAENAIGYETQGWLELSSSLRLPGSIDDQGRLVRQWQNNWPGHPAAQILPAELALLANLAATRPERIVLAVPLQGNLASAGKAIRDGFLAAYYADDSKGDSELDIQILDTTAEEFSALYQQLAETRTDLIVGPLDKSSLTQLAELNTLPVPVLGLNYLPVDSNVPTGLFQFGLSAEDEARQIADQLANDDVEKLLALIPYGEWGDRVEAALRQRMEEQGLTLLNIQRFFPEDNLRSIAADSLGITESRNRAIDVERTIGLDVEFEPRRRQDAEGIVMVAAPTAARQLKPLFAFYYGGDLPVYAPSIVYEGTPDPTRDRDLNDVLFTDIPWILQPSSELRQQADQYLSGTRGQLGRLFAMGADAWQLSKRLPLLQQVDGAAIQGQTGTLTMTADGRILREQIWARMDNGTPIVIQPEPEMSEDTQPLETTFN
ncbi:MAG: penicillin-binding protein activator [Pseudomonadota bacterium]|nr:penicillin-binding protein activator [Pseudomonadota bacterium]